MAIERTLSIIKPDGLEKGVIGKIITRFEDGEGLHPVAIRLQWLSQKEAEGFYAVHKARPFFKDLVTFMTQGPVVLMVLDGASPPLHLTSKVAYLGFTAGSTGVATVDGSGSKWTNSWVSLCGQLRQRDVEYHRRRGGQQHVRLDR